MSYTPKPGHVITFADTYDNKTLYLVESVSGTRVKVSPVNPPDEAYTAGFHLSLTTFQDMGGTPVVLSDEEMASMELIYAAMLLDALDKTDMARVMSAVFGLPSDLILSEFEMERILAELKQFEAGLKFLREARTGALA